MTLTDDPTSRAVDELNRRLVRAHRRMTAGSRAGPRRERATPDAPGGRATAVAGDERAGTLPPAPRTPSHPPGARLV